MRLLAHERTRECLTIKIEREHVKADFHWGTAYLIVRPLEIPAPYPWTHLEFEVGPQSRA